MKLNVLCNPGQRGEEIPCAFYLGGRRLPVVAVLGRWSEPAHRCFEVSVSDGRRFVLRQDVAARCWELAGVFAAAKPKPAKPAAAKPQAAPKRWFAAWRG